MTIAVTGATGALGARVAARLAERKVDQLLVVRDLARVPAIAGIEAVQMGPRGYRDETALTEVLAGCETLFLVSGRESATRVVEHAHAVQAAVAAGVRRIVYTSFLNAGPDASFTFAHDHFATEQLIRESGLAWTFLRNSLYLDFLPLLAGEDGVIRGPAGRGRVAAVARADVARTAAAVLTDSASHRGATYTLTGPEALTLEEAARIITEATGREVSFHDETLEEAYASRRRWDASQWQYDAWVSTYTAIRAGEVEDVLDDVRALTGRHPLSLRELLANGEPV
jgi:NAD(P)H dehydrogenase (quinone)